MREKAASFLDLCLDAKRAAEITLQPLRRFDLVIKLALLMCAIGGVSLLISAMVRSGTTRMAHEVEPPTAPQPAAATAPRPRLAPA